MCGRLSQYSGIHDFVAPLSMPNAVGNIRNQGSDLISPFDTIEAGDEKAMGDRSKCFVVSPARTSIELDLAQGRRAKVESLCRL
jgi:hypothetical protein